MAVRADSSRSSFWTIRRFFFVRTLRRLEFRDFLPYPKDRDRLPSILSLDEVARLIAFNSQVLSFGTFGNARLSCRFRRAVRSPRPIRRAEPNSSRSSDRLY